MSARSIAEAALDVAQERAEPHGFVYLIREHGSALAKIGYTENLRARLGAQRRWANGLARPAKELRAVLVCEFQTRDQAYNFEASLLAVGEALHGTGYPVDWFPLTADDEFSIAWWAMRKEGFVSAWGWLG